MPTKWTAKREKALAFIDRFSAEAHRLGWTAPQLFGVHPEHGTVRVDFCGALMIGTATALEARATGSCSSGRQLTGTCRVRSGARRSGIRNQGRLAGLSGLLFECNQWLSPGRRQVP